MGTFHTNRYGVPPHWEGAEFPNVQSSQRHFTYGFFHFLGRPMKSIETNRTRKVLPPSVMRLLSAPPICYSGAQGPDPLEHPDSLWRRRATGPVISRNHKDNFPDRWANTQTGERPFLVGLRKKNINASTPPFLAQYTG